MHTMTTTHHTCAVNLTGYWVCSRDGMSGAMLARKGLAERLKNRDMETIQNLKTSQLAWDQRILGQVGVGM